MRCGPIAAVAMRDEFNADDFFAQGVWRRISRTIFAEVLWYGGASPDAAAGLL